MGGIVEFQAAARVLARTFTRTLRNSGFCSGEQSPDGELLVDRIEWPDAAILRAGPPTAASIEVPSMPRDPDPSFVDVPARRVQIVQPFQIFVVERSKLIASGLDPTVPRAIVELQLVMQLVTRRTNGGTGFELALEAIDIEGSIPQEVEAIVPGVRARMLAAMQAAIPGARVPLGLAALGGLGIPAAIRNAGACVRPVASTAPAELVAVRLEQTLPSSERAWEAFLGNGPTDRLALPRNLGTARSPDDWGLHVDKDLLGPAITRLVENALAGSRDRIRLESGPWWSWDSGEGKARFHVRFSGEALDACDFVLGKSDVGIDVQLVIDLSVARPQPNDPNGLRVHVKVNFWKDDWDMTGCELTMALLMPIVAAKHLDEKLGIPWWVVAAASVALVATAFVLPCLALGIYLAAIAAGEKYGLDKGLEVPKLPRPLPSCRTIDPDKGESECFVPFAFDLGGLLGPLELTDFTGAADGLQLFGRAPVVVPEDRPLRVTPGTWFADIALTDCPSPQRARELQENAAKNLRHSISVTFETLPNGNAERSPLVFCSAAFVAQRDPLGVFKGAKLQVAQQGRFAFVVTIEVAPVSAAYLAAPYPGLLLVRTSRGARVVTIAIVPSHGDREAAGIVAAKIEAICAAKTREADWPRGRIEQLFLDDPDRDRDRDRSKLWEIEARGLAVGTEAALRDLAGNTLASGHADSTGLLRLLARGDAAHDRVVLERRSNGTRSLPIASGTAGMLSARVRSLTELGAIPFVGALRSTSIGLVASRPHLVVATTQGTTVHDLTALPLPLLRASAPAAAGALLWANRVIDYGPAGLRVVYEDASSGETTMLARPVRAVAPDGQRLLVLTDDEVLVVGRDGERCACFRLPREAHAIAFTSGTLLVADVEGIAAYRLEHGELRSTAQLRMTGVEGLVADARLLGRGRVYARRGCGGTTIAIGRGQQLEVASQSDAHPWIAGATVGAGLLAIAKPKAIELLALDGSRRASTAVVRPDPAAPSC